jgi:type I restriction enzyme M protein
MFEQPEKGLLKQLMNQFAHNKLVSFIWSIADDCLRDVYVRGKYRDVILPMVVLRRLDTLLEPTT